MKLLLAAILLVSFLSGGLRTIARINTYAQEAAQAYRQQDYTRAIAAYEYLLNDLDVQDDQLRLNLAHAYYQAGAPEKAQESYRLLAEHPSSHLRAIAHLQLGNIAAGRHKYKQALARYRQALIADPDNEKARYDYELLKKYLALHPEKATEDEPQKLPPPSGQGSDSLQTPPPAQENQEPQPGSKPDDAGTDEKEMDTPQPSGTPTEQQQQGGGKGNQLESNSSQASGNNGDQEEASGTEPGDTKGQTMENATLPNQQGLGGGSENITDQDQRAQTQRRRLQQVNMSPEKARLLLDAMRNAELQYIQQLPKKSDKKPDRSKPDW
ncbi:tetratricopeptide repeat protein [Pontibacter liquoris]|uniref:tetratricopeptide repeat protein n=1 Tax=Pontibacter liquoris TaxID=2905677 RepID=UPI001FA7A285|nr:tetratricopeptide repeat protein [Pontibacter liquoris]